MVFVAMAGPLANLALVVVGVCGLAVSESASPGRLLLNPLLAYEVADSALTPLATLSALLIAANWPLFLLNLAPAAPFDGGVALRAWLGVWLGRETANEAARTLSMLVAVGLLGVGGTLALVAVTSPLVPAALAALSVLIAFGSRGESITEPEPRPLGLRLDDVGGVSLTDLPAAPLAPADLDGPLDGSLDGPFLGQGLEEPESLWDETRVDAVLAKVHKLGFESLTANERAILERASLFYQRRRGEG